MKYTLLCFLTLLVFSVGTAKAESPTITPLERSKLAQVERINQFNQIALCESGNDPHAKNPYSSASGRFQFLWGTWNHYGKELWGVDFYEKSIWDYNDNTELAWYVYGKYGTGDWLASVNCWKR